MFPKEYTFEVSKDNRFVRYETVRGAFNVNAAGYVVDKRLQPGEVAACVSWDYIIIQHKGGEMDLSTILDGLSEAGLNTLRGRDRVCSLVYRFEQSARHGHIDYDYGQAAYGLQWSLTSGRLNAETANTIEAMNVQQLCDLIHELKEYEYRIGFYPLFLMKKYTNQVEV